MISNRETNCTVEFLKAYAGKFDTDTVFILNLKNRNITKINAISKCSNLITLNISQNKITTLTGMETLQVLKYLDASFNCLSSLDGADELPNLKQLVVTGNKIDYNKKIGSQCGLYNLTSLYFQEMNNNDRTANPIVNMKDYRNEMFKAFINLKWLDGVKKGYDILAKEKDTFDFDTNKLKPANFDFDLKEKINMNIETVFDKEEIEKGKEGLDKKYEQFQRELSKIKRDMTG